jgi:hypothetical protein
MYIEFLATTPLLACRSISGGRRILCGLYYFSFLFIFRNTEMSAGDKSRHYVRRVLYFVSTFCGFENRLLKRVFRPKGKEVKSEGKRQFSGYKRRWRIILKWVLNKLIVMYDPVLCGSLSWPAWLLSALGSSLGCSFIRSIALADATNFCWNSSHSYTLSWNRFLFCSGGLRVSILAAYSKVPGLVPTVDYSQPDGSKATMLNRH